MGIRHILAAALVMVEFSSGFAIAQSIGGSAIEADHRSPQLTGPFLTWLDQDVRWIISAEERLAYMALPSDAERLQFIKEFWQRRNPDLASTENKFKEEHYRRIAYSNAHFATTHPGWMTDRGRTYIVNGKPDSIDAYPSGESGETRPTEVWHYRTLRGQNSSAGQSGLDLKFVDNCKCGNYELVSPSKF